MGIGYIVAGALVLAVGVLGALATLQNAMGFVGAVLICILGAIFLTAGAIIEAIHRARRDLLKK